MGWRMMRKRWIAVLTLASASVALAAGEYSPNLKADYRDRVFFGDTHLHTAYSADAGMVGNRLGPDAAYRFAKGEVVTASMGMKARIRRPLDFLVIADHSESLGIAPMVNSRDPLALADPIGRQLIDFVAKGDFTAAYRLYAMERRAGRPVLHNDAIRRSMWDRIIDAAETHNQPGSFTAFIGYEFTSVLRGDNLHRVVIFQDGRDKAGSVLPFSSNESSNPEDLWAYLAAYEKATSGRALAIPHNGNLSNGTMFDVKTLGGGPITAEYAARRQRWEPLYEVTQIKGDGETHPVLSPNDEFADYYRWDRGNFGIAPKTRDMLPREYARAALKQGLAWEAKLGVNPFKFGMIGSTDSHTSLATTEEANFFGKVSPLEPGTGDTRYRTAITQQFSTGESFEQFGYDSLSSGLVGVWARANTRKDLFEAMARREVFATTGTRMRVRMFGGWGFAASDLARPDLSRIGYGKGVPMGSDLTGSGRAPGFLVEAMRDPDGANLDRIQIVKGWIDTKGEMHEKVYDVAWSGRRKPGKGGKLPPVGNTVKGAEYSNSIGAPVLSAWWQDPDFKPGERAFYYARVLEIPTPSWIAYDMAAFGIARPSPKAVLVQQERAYGSPIWYSPKG